MDKDSKGGCAWCGRGGHGYGLGVILLIIGLYFIAQDLGWISGNISFWPAALAVLGLYLIFKHKK